LPRAILRDPIAARLEQPAGFARRTVTIERRSFIAT
jgi:hypothetical protein